jgi:hypothetical protein
LPGVDVAEDEGSQAAIRGHGDGMDEAWDAEAFARKWVGGFREAKVVVFIHEERQLTVTRDRGSAKSDTIGEVGAVRTVALGGFLPVEGEVSEKRVSGDVEGGIGS